MISESVYKQYMEIQERHPEGYLFFQVGVFMQIMGENARALGPLLNIKITLGGEPGRELFRCGFPVSALDKYVGKTLRGGYSVIIASKSDRQNRESV